jgi:hypothetical protein
MTTVTTTAHDGFRHVAAAAAVVLLLGSAGHEVWRVAGDHPWPRFPAWASDAVSVILIASWVTAAVALLRRRASAGWAQLAWVLSLLAPVTMLGHGLVTRSIGDAWQGAAYAAAAVLLALALKGTFGGGEYHRLRGRVVATRGPGEGARRTP